MNGLGSHVVFARRPCRSLGVHALVAKPSCSTEEFGVNMLVVTMSALHACDVVLVSAGLSLDVAPVERIFNGESFGNGMWVHMKIHHRFK